MNRPANAYENAMLSADTIEHHPLNYIQEVYCTTKQTVEGQSGNFRMEFEMVSAALNHADNVCGSAYCRAGWVTLLALGIEQDNGTLTTPLPGDPNDDYPWDDLAEVLMGIYRLPYAERDEDYRTMHAEWGQLTSAAANPREYGDAEYATMGAAGLRDWATTWRTRLEAIRYTYNPDGSVTVTDRQGNPNLIVEWDRIRRFDAVAAEDEDEA